MALGPHYTVVPPIARLREGTVSQPTDLLCQEPPLRLLLALSFSPGGLGFSLSADPGLGQRARLARSLPPGACPAHLETPGRQVRQQHVAMFEPHV